MKQRIGNLASTSSEADRSDTGVDPRAGLANCGCWYHAEEGIPCEHDIALAEERAAKALGQAE